MGLPQFAKEYNQFPVKGLSIVSRFCARCFRVRSKNGPGQPIIGESPIAPAFLRPLAQGIFLPLSWILFLLLVLNRLTMPLFDADLFWHLASGRWIIENRSFLHTDVFSFPLFGAVWRNPEWVFQVLAYGVYSWVGWPGLIGMKLVLGFTGLWLLMVVLRRILGTQQVWLLPLTWLGFKILEPRLFERAELISWICWGGLWIWLTGIPRWGRKSLGHGPDQECSGSIEENSDSTELLGSTTLHSRFADQFRSPAWVIPIFALWTNSHPSVVYGWTFLCLTALGAYWAREPVPSKHRLVQGAVLAGLACLLNPDGVRMAGFYLASIGQMRSGLGIIEEWGSPGLVDAPFFWVIFFIVGSLSIAAVRQNGLTWRRWVPAAFFFAVYGSRHFRSTALAAWTCLPLIAFALARVQKIRWQSVLGAVSVTLVLLVMGGSTLMRRPSARPLVAWSLFPKGAAEFLRDNAIQGKGYNPYGFGGYLQWALGPDYKTYMDGRYLSFPLIEKERQILSEMGRRQDPALWTTRSDREGFTIAITGYMEDFWDFWEERRGRPEDLFFDRLYPPREWALVYWDDIAMVFCRRIPMYSSLIQEKEYRVFKPYGFDRSPIPQQAGVYDQERSRHQRDVPVSVRRALREKGPGA